MILGSTNTYILSYLFIFSLANVAHAQDSVQVNSQLSLPQSETDTTQQSDLEQFRKAFEKLVDEQQKQPDKATNPETTEQDPALELGGFILDETRSKLARDFYDLFYQNWEAPEEASNFTVTISERPSFGRGTQVTVKLNYEEIYSARLQPRYEYIEAVSQQAAARARQVLQQQADVRQQLTGY